MKPNEQLQVTLRLWRTAPELWHWRRQESAYNRNMVTIQSTESIEREMLRLNPEARAKLVHSLVKSLGDLSESELEGSWLDEAERRDAELESDSVEAVPGDEVFNRIRSRHGF